MTYSMATSLVTADLQKEIASGNEIEDLLRIFRSKKLMFRIRGK